METKGEINMTDLTQKEFSRRGGLITLKKYGRKFYSKIGKDGVKAKIKKYGTEYFIKLSKAGVEARRLKREAQKPLVEKIVDVIMEGGEKK